jgi:iron complex transport system substrate-binding protein
LSKNIVGTSSNPTREILRDLQPDCIIVWSYNKNLIADLEGRLFKVVGFYPRNIADCEWVIHSIGNLTGRISQATSLVSSMEARLAIVADRIANIPVDQRPLVYYEQKNGNSVGKGSLGNDIITLAGGMNIYWNSTKPNPTFSLEFPRDANPDFIIVDNASADNNTEIASRAGWNSITAVQENHIYRINARMWSTTPRVVDAIEQLVEWFYPT